MLHGSTLPLIEPVSLECVRAFAEAGVGPAALSGKGDHAPFFTKHLSRGDQPPAVSLGRDKVAAIQTVNHRLWGGRPKGTFEGLGEHFALRHNRAAFEAM